MNPSDGLSAAANVAQALISVHKGEPVEAARHAIAAALDLVPKDVAEHLLSDEALRRQQVAADLLEVAKFGTSKL